jgi:hypothetical protein
MSKTVKRVMTVMMVGLVAMLGAKAEAHYIMLGGKLKYCSVCCVVDLVGVPNPHSGGEVKCEATASSILCPDGTEYKQSVPMIGQSQIDNTNWKNGKATVKVPLPVPASVLALCSAKSGSDVKFPTIPFAEICAGQDLGDPSASCASSSPASTHTFTGCTLLSNGFYDCAQTIVHIE